MIGAIKMNKKEVTAYIVAITVIQCLVSCGIFVTYPQMTAYAVSKDTMEVVLQKLDKIDNKLDLLTTAK